MPSYLYSNDTRISELPDAIRKACKTIMSGQNPFNVDKSLGNNGSTVQFYFNLQSGTETLNLGFNKTTDCILNFILKFQFPNTRTKESFDDSIKEKTLLAPYRSVISLLYKLSQLDNNGISFLSFDEILYFVFCNKEVCRNPRVNYDQVVQEIIESRKHTINHASAIITSIRWKHYERQIKEMMAVLRYAFDSITVKGGVTFSHSIAIIKNEIEVIDKIMRYHYMWYPSDTTNFELAQSEYICYMDTKNTSFTVIDFKSDAKKNIVLASNEPLQKIFYGAPGTGKSHKTNEVVRNYPDTIRTTFHPDTDYASFVGAYKPTMKLSDVVAAKVVTNMSTSYTGLNVGTYKEDKITYEFVQQAFLKAYILAWKKMANAHFVKSLGTVANGSQGSGIPLEIPNEKPDNDKEINPNEEIGGNEGSIKDYDKTEWSVQRQYLVIEEINRGNCAQIFGDLFQLLDRKNGFSEYPIEADEDLRKELRKEFAGLSFDPVVKDYINHLFVDNDGECQMFTYKTIDENGDEIEAGGNAIDAIINGKILVLPCNFYIWATMNTSDQSLFPMDSAFKRRWEWEYVRIAEAFMKGQDGKYSKDSNGNKIPFGWQIDGGLDWWSFISQVNKIVKKMTYSADKQLGYFFCKPDLCKNGSAEKTIISYDKLVGKVFFYLWNDVFKDYLSENRSLFSYKEKDVECDIEFDSFFMDDDEEGTVVDKSVVWHFIDNVMKFDKSEDGKKQWDDEKEEFMPQTNNNTKDIIDTP